MKKREFILKKSHNYIQYIELQQQIIACVANNLDQKVMVTNEEKSEQEAQQVRVLSVKA